jgi:hypothetical protein
LLENRAGEGTGKGSVLGIKFLHFSLFVLADLFQHRFQVAAAHKKIKTALSGGFLVHGSRLKIPLFASSGEIHNSLPRKILQPILLKTHGFLKNI